MDRIVDGDRPRSIIGSNKPQSFHSSIIPSTSNEPLSRSVSSNLTRSTSRRLFKSASLARTTSKSLLRSASKSRIVRSASKSLIRGCKAETKPKDEDNPWGVEPDNFVETRSIGGIVNTSPSLSPTSQFRARLKNLNSVSSAFPHIAPRRASTVILGMNQRPKEHVWRGSATFAGKKSRQSNSSTSGEDEIQFVVEEVPSLCDDEFVTFSTAPKRPRERFRDIVKRMMTKQPPALRKSDRSDDVT